MNTDSVEEFFNAIANNVAARNRGVAESDDIKQELWVWWLSHGAPDVLDADWALKRTLYTVAERYAAKERNARMGPEQQHQYQPEEVMALVEFLVNPPTDGTNDTIGAELADVMTAVANLPFESRGYLVSYAAGESYRQIAEDSGQSVSTVFRRVQQALADILTALNGAPKK